MRTDQRAVVGDRTTQAVGPCLNVSTMAVLLAAMVSVLSHGGLILAEWIMLVAYAITLPWLSIGLWNSVIGFCLDRRYGAGAAAHVTPALARISGRERITTRTAIIMPLRNEDPTASISRLRTLQASLAQRPGAARSTTMC